MNLNILKTYFTKCLDILESSTIPLGLGWFLVDAAILIAALLPAEQ